MDFLRLGRRHAVPGILGIGLEWWRALGQGLFDADGRFLWPARDGGLRCRLRRRSHGCHAQLAGQEAGLGLGCLGLGCLGLRCLGLLCLGLLGLHAGLVGLAGLGLLLAFGGLAWRRAWIRWLAAFCSAAFLS
ncbi:hypothetical protein [Magnetospira sp. QH-2]|uniref:hypothetical protein n=1 Tax=Magnetospira sp. (strain QH-2) TaxID=1288970 RepID=UPI00130D57D2|nr:hypothetical protein [Magnetospira sp. QH-2]